MSYELVVFFMLAVGLAQPVFAADEHVEGPLFIHRVAADPTDPRMFYAVTGNMGLLRTEDAGRTWIPSNRGLRSFTHHGLAVTASRDKDRPTLYIGGWGGGVSRSVDGGRSWTEINGDLGNTAIDAIAADPSRPQEVWVATTTGVFRTIDDGAHWRLENEGLHALSEAVGYKTLVIEPSPTPRLWLATEAGLFQRDLAQGPWRPDRVLGTARLSALVYDPAGRRLYAGTIKQGVHVRSDDAWRSLGGEEWFVSAIAVHPARPRELYLATRGAGVLRSLDGGATWSTANTGLGLLDIRSLAIHPAMPVRLVAGTSSRGFWYSTDGGARWSPADPVPPRTMEGLLAMLAPSPAPATAAPPVMAKCNACHGWSDAPLNSKRTYWRVPANARSWAPTVARMAQRAGLTGDERREVTTFLTAYSRQGAAR